MTRKPQMPHGESWFSIRAKASPGGTSAVVDIYDEIGWYGITAKDFATQLRALDVDTIQLNVNSPGGDVFDGIAILNEVRAHKARIVATVQGIAASAASFIIMGADEVVMARNSELMIHDAWGIAMGNAEDMRDLAARLDKVSDNIASIYAERTGGTVKDWRKAMVAESWYSADEAVEAGLADRVDAKKDGEDAKDRFDLSVFNHYGRADAPEPYRPVRATLKTGEYVLSADSLAAYTPAMTAANGAVAATLTTNRTTPYTHAGGLVTSTSNGLVWTGANPSLNRPPAEQLADHPPTEGVADMPSDTLVTGLRARLGIPADATLTEDGILSALDEALSEQVPATIIENRTVPEGTVLVDEAEYAGLQAAAQMGREARERQISEDRITLVNLAVQEGRIPPARRDHWVAQLAADPGAADVLTSLAKGTLPTNELGFTGGIEEAPDDDLYNRLFSKEG